MNEAQYDREVERLKTFFDNVNISEPIRIDECSVCTNLPTLLKTHFNILKLHKGKRIVLPYLYRLQIIKKTLELKTP